MSIDNKLKKLGWKIDQQDIYYAEYTKGLLAVKIKRVMGRFDVFLYEGANYGDNSMRLLLPKETKLFWKEAKAKDRKLKKIVAGRGMRCLI